VNGGQAKSESATKAGNNGTAKNIQASTPNENTNGASAEPEAKEKQGPCGLPSKCSIL